MTRKIPKTKSWTLVHSRIIAIYSHSGFSLFPFCSLLLIGFPFQSHLVWYCVFLYSFCSLHLSSSNIWNLPFPPTKNIFLDSCRIFCVWGGRDIWITYTGGGHFARGFRTWPLHASAECISVPYPIMPHSSHITPSSGSKRTRMLAVAVHLDMPKMIVTCITIYFLMYM